MFFQMRLGRLCDQLPCALPQQIRQRVRRNPSGARNPTTVSFVMWHIIRHCLSDHVWMAPAWQGGCGFQASGRLRPCIRCPDAVLVLRTMMKSAWKWSQSMARAVMRFGPNGVSSSFCRQFAITSRCTLPLWAAPVRGRNFVSGHLGLIAFAGLYQGPDGAGHAGGEGDCDQLDGFALEHVPQPIFPGGFVAAVSDLGEGAAGMGLRCQSELLPNSWTVFRRSIKHFDLTLDHILRH